jgi:hypothetical protein
MLTDVSVKARTLAVVFRLAAICTIPPVLATTLAGVALRRFSSLGFFVLYGFIIGAAATGFGLAIGRWTNRAGRGHARRE